MDPATIALLGDLFDKKIENLENRIVEKVTEAVSDSVSERVSKTVDKKIESVVAPMMKRQDDFEARSETKMDDLQKQISSISEILKCQAADKIQSQFPPQPIPGQAYLYAAAAAAPAPAPPAPSAHPAMRVANTSSIANRNRVRDNNHAYLLNIVNSAKFVIGVSPLTPKHVEDQVVAPGEDALVKAAIEYLWKELNVRESEISESDIEKVFLPAKSNRADFTKLYIRFKSQEQANLCLYLAKSLTVPQNKISRYFPRQFNARVKTLGHVAHQLRNGEPKYKTSIEYTEDDIVLLVCPLDSFNYQPYFVENLPAIDLRPPRSPPVGRKLKRTRSDSTSPLAKEKKKDRKVSPVKVHANSNSNVQAEPNDNSEPLDDPEPLMILNQMMVLSLLRMVGEMSSPLMTKILTLLSLTSNSLQLPLQPFQKMLVTFTTFKLAVL